MLSCLELNPRVVSRVALGFAILVSGLTFLSGCKPLPPSKAEALFTPEEARGAEVFHSYCARCHYPTTTRGRKGPGLQALTKVKEMPSGAPPTDERLLFTIRHGHGMMQPVPVPEDELAPLLAYLRTL